MNTTACAALAAHPFTRLPHAVLDTYLPQLTGAETKLLMVLLRQTLGYQRDSVELSITELQSLTGLTSRSTIDRCARTLERLKLFRVGRRSGGSRANRYQLIASDITPPHNPGPDHDPHDHDDDSPITEPSTDRSEDPVSPLSGTPGVHSVDHMKRKKKGGTEMDQKTTHTTMESHAGGAPSSAVQALIHFGMWPATAEHLVAEQGLNHATVTAAINGLNEEIRRGSAIRNPPALLKTRLMQGWQPPGWYRYAASESQPCRKIESSSSPDADVRIAEGTRKVRTIFSSAWVALKLQLPREAFDTWLRAAELDSWQVDDDGMLRGLTISLPNKYALTWIEQRLHGVIAEAVARIVGRRIDITYTVRKREQAS